MSISMSRTARTAAAVAGFAGLAMMAQAAAQSARPDFSSNHAGWVGQGDIVVAPGSPPNVSQDPAHAYVKSGWITGIVVFAISFISLALTEETFGKDLNYLEV